MPGNSRRPFDEGREGEPAGEFEYAVPGPAGGEGHYHVVCAGRGAYAPAWAGPVPGEGVRVLVLEVTDSMASAVAVRDAMASLGLTPVLLDPSAAGGCGDPGGHREGRFRSSPPPVRVVRARIDGKGGEGAEAAAVGAAGGGAAGEAVLRGERPAAWLDVHLLEAGPR